MSQMLDAEYKCRKCGKAVSFEQYESSRFCPNCDTFLSSLSRVNHWMFQFNPAIYRWFDRIRECREPEQWLASRYARKIQKGDKGVVWASGEKAGVYAIGEIMTNPEKRSLATKQEKYWTRKEDTDKFREKHSVTMDYSRLSIDRPLLENACRTDPTLSDMTVLKQPQGTNFHLTKRQWVKILELIG